MTKNNVTWWEKFSPTIMETEVPQKFIDIINNTGDEVLKDDGLSKKYDFSDNLVGKVHKEVSIPVPDEDKSYCLSILRQACVRDLRQMIRLGRAYDWKKKAGNREPSEENIKNASNKAKELASPISDMRGTVEHRKDLIEVLTRRTLSKSVERVGV